MARKLKTYETSLGFFDLAIAAPSMKAALEAWGAVSNLFHQGQARESEDPDVISSAMKKPGVVLKRPVGFSGPFTEHAELPTNIEGDGSRRKPAKKVKKAKASKSSKKRKGPRDTAAERKAARAYEQAEKQRERERARAEATREKERQRRKAAEDKAQRALDDAREKQEAAALGLKKQIEALQAKAQAENARWDKEKNELKAVLRRAKE